MAKQVRPRTVRSPSHKHVIKGEAAIPRTAAEATERGHPKAEFDLDHEMAALSNRIGTHFSAAAAQPGDVAWVGPCEGTGTRIVCYYDQAMEPTDCRNQPC